MILATGAVSLVRIIGTRTLKVRKTYRRMWVICLRKLNRVSQESKQLHWVWRWMSSGAFGKKPGLLDSVWGGRVWKHAYIWGRVGSLGWLKHREGRFKLLWDWVRHLSVLGWDVYTWKQWEWIVFTKVFGAGFCRWSLITSVFLY